MNKKNSDGSRNSAIVLGIGITGLGVIRNLGRNDVRIIGIDSDPLAVGSFSKYCNKKFTCKNMILNETFVEFLKSVIRQTGEGAVIIPTEDRYVKFVSDYRERLEEDFIFVIPDKDTCEAILNKQLFYNLALKHGIPVPRTFFPGSEREDVVSISRQIQYPCIIKPVHSKEWDFASTVKAIVAFDAKDLIDKYTNMHMHNNSEVLIQEIVTGYDNQQYSFCAYLDRGSRLLAAFVSRKMRQHPVGFGVGTYVESAIMPEIEKMGEDFLRKIKYKGIAEVEFKKDSRDNQFKMIEINARSWTQNTLPTRSGINIVYMYYLDAIGKSIVGHVKTNKKVKWINDYRDIVSSIQYMSNKELSVAEWAKSLKGKKEFALYSKDDIIPFLFFPIYSMIKLSKDVFIKFKKNRVINKLYWSYFFSVNEGILFSLKLLLRKVVRYEHFLVMARDLHDDSIFMNKKYINVKKATDNDMQLLQANMNLYAFENYRNKFSMVKTCFFVYCERAFAGLSWVYFKGEGYKHYELSSEEAAIGPIYTRGEFRGQGIAPELVSNICDYLKDRGYSRAIGIVSKRNNSSIRMFEKSGFKKNNQFKSLKILNLKIF